MAASYRGGLPAVPDPLDAERLGSTEAAQDDTIMFEGMVFRGVHSWRVCQANGPRACVIHRPSGHHMRNWPLTWRQDRSIFERHCQHGIGHPDPDQYSYWMECGQQWAGVHGCDGCCSQPAEVGT